MRGMPQQKLHTLVTQPPPSRGLNTTGDLAAMAPTDAVEMDNLIASELGLTVRGGWREYATNIGGGTTDTIRTIMAYNGAPANAMVSPLTASELWAAIDDGIYLVEGGGDLSALAPSIALSGSTFAGSMSWVNFTSSGGGQYLIACSETDGGYLYDGVSWMKMTSVGAPGPGVITGVDPADFVQVVAWKRRLAFVKRGTGQAWFLPAGAVGGAASLFDFGPQLEHGGAVLGLANWTQDDGGGMDDRLVILGSSGDLVIYQGTDPTVATEFENAGTWFIGQPPVGRRSFTTSGGNVYVLTQFGVIPVNQIVQGGLDNILTSNTDLLVQLRKIQDALNTDFQTLLNTPGWELLMIPQLALLVINRPSIAANEFIQYAFQQHSLSWCRLLDIPASTMARRLNEIYSGTADGRILRILDGSVDGVLLDGSDSREIRARLTPAFSYFGDPTVVKQALMMRASFLARTRPAWTVEMNVDFEVSPVNGSVPAGETVGSLWDASFWDAAYWAGGRTNSAEWRTVQGIGYALAPSLFIACDTQTTLTSLEYMMKPGGPW